MLDALLFTKTSPILASLYPDCVWKVNTKEKNLYLTFDDGPIPEITPFVLDELKKWKAKATFFCIGKNIEANPEIFKRIIREGHSIGNHTYNHTNGWKHTNLIYYKDIQKCARLISSFKIQHSAYPTPHLFRPPYGKLKISQYRALRSKYKIIMWDVLTFDFDLKKNAKSVLSAAVKHSAPGSVVVFHDSLKAKPKVEYALPKVLEHFTAKGFKFEKL